MQKTTKNNPASFQKVVPKTFLMLVKKMIRKVQDGNIRSAKNFIISETLNYSNYFRVKNNYFCNLCKQNSSYFLHTSNEKRVLYNSVCPNCSSRKRHRGLYEIYKNILADLNSPKILHFAPEPVFYKLFQSFEYLTADLDLKDVDLHLDIQNIDYKSNSFDLILCNHVLEHVLDDKKALKELYRLLKPSGITIITVPGDWGRDKTIEYEFPDGNGHYRDYGLNFIDLLDAIFNTIEYIDLYKYNSIYNLPIGLTLKHDLAFLCYKK